MKLYTKQINELLLFRWSERMYSQYERMVCATDPFERQVACDQMIEAKRVLLALQGDSKWEV